MFMETPDAIVQITASVLTLCGVMFVALMAKRGLKQGTENLRQTTQINDAVNHSDRTGTERIYDLVLNNSAMAVEFKASLEKMDKRLDRIEHNCPGCALSHHETEFRHTSLSPGTGEGEDKISLFPKDLTTTQA